MRHKLSMISVAELWFLLLFVFTVKGELYWDILKRVTDFGQTAELICVTGSSIRPPVGHWDRYIPDSSITYAVITNTSGPPFLKYYGKFVEDGFTLEIRNLSREDLNVYYECSVDVNKSKPRVLLEKDVFAGNVNLLVLEKGARYGDKLILLCVTESCNNKRCHWKYGWTKFVNGQEILIKTVPDQDRSSDSKYYIQLVSDGFTLEIRNVSIADLNVNYLCALPFNKSDALNLTEAEAFEVTVSTTKVNDKLIENALLIGGLSLSLMLVTIAVLLFIRKCLKASTTGEVERLPMLTPIDRHTESIREEDSIDQDGTMTNDGRTRYARLSRVVFELFKDIMVDCANDKIKPTCLHQLLNNDIFKKSLIPKEKDMFDSLPSNGYYECDAGFICKLLIQSGCLPSPSNGWMSTPVEGAVSESDDINRMWHLRFKILYTYKTDISETEHEQLFTVFKAVGERFDRKLNKTPDHSYKKQIDEIETCCFEPNDVDIYIQKALDHEMIKLQKTEKDGEMTCRLNFGNSINTAINYLQWEDYNETKVALIITSPETDFTAEQFDAIRRLMETFNKTETLIQMIDVKAGCIVVSTSVHPFVFQSAMFLTNEFMKLLRETFECLHDTIIRNIDAVLVGINDEFGESSIPLFYYDDGSEAKQNTNADLVLTTKMDGSHQKTESHLCRETLAIVKDIVKHGDISISKAYVIMSSNSTDLPQFQAQSAVDPQMQYTTRLRQKYNEYMPIHGCALVGTTIVLASNAQKNLVLIDTVGRSRRTITLSGKGYFVSVINNTTVAVTLLNECIIQVVDLNTGDVVNEIGINKMTYHICYYEEEFFVSLGKEIEVIDQNGSVLRKLPVPNFITRITVEKNRLYYETGDTLYCCDLYGKVIWRFSDEVIKTKLIADNNGNVFFLGTSRCNVLMVTSDGKCQKELISDSESIEMREIKAMCCDRKCDLFVLADAIGSVFLFEVLKPKESVKY